MFRIVKRIIKGVKQTILHFGLISFIVIPVFTLLNVLLFIGINIQHDIIDTSINASAQSELSNISMFVNTRISSLHDDIHIVVNSNEATNYLENQTPENLDAYQQMLMRIMQSKDTFLKTNIMNPNGDITYQINRLSDDSLVTSTTSLGSIANASFFPYLSTINPDQIFITELFLNNNIPTLSLYKPLYQGDNMVSILSFDVSAEQILAIIENYSGEHVDFLHFGLINHQAVWSYSTDGQINVNHDPAVLTETLNDIETNPYIVSHNITFTDESNHFVTFGDNSLNFYVTMHYQEALQASSYYLLRYPWLAIVINLVLLSFVSYIAVLIKSRDNDRLLTNANIYLSEQSNDAVVVTNYDTKIIYTNQTFMKHYEYLQDEVIGQKLNDLIGVEHFNTTLNKNMQSEFEYFNWTKTRSNIYLLRHLRVKSESAVRKTRRHYIYVYSEPRIELEDYQKYFTRKDETLVAFNRFLTLQPFHINQTVAFILKLEETNVIKFAEYIMMHCPYLDVMAQIKHNYLLIYTQIKDRSFDQMINEFDLLIERYRYLPYISHDFTSLLVASRADETVNTVDKLMDSLIVSLEIGRSNPNEQHVIYRAGMQEKIEREKEILNELFNGFTNNEFHVVYQPQVHLKSGKYFGVESLLRWDNAKLGAISPVEFIPIIENSFFVNQLSAMVLRKVIKDFEPYADKLPDKFKLSINITPFDFKDVDMIKNLIEIIEESKISSDHFIFEITESHYIDNIEKTNKMVELLHAKDIMIAIDDFGTGYSSINSLKSIQVDLVKLDRSFIKDYPDMDDGDMIKTIITLVRGLHKTVIVEGTETQAHIDLCNEHHCEYVQGYYISKPVSIKEIAKLCLLNE